MKVLVTIAHYFNAQGDGKYVSTSPDSRPRIQACRASIIALQRLFGRPQYQMNISRWGLEEVKSQESIRLDILLCTTRGQHLVDQLNLPADAYRHVATDVEPKMLGFECQRLLSEARGEYDLYCFLEDDLVIHDPWFLRKVAWFNSAFGDGCLLQPNRFEFGDFDFPVSKLFLDGDLPERSASSFQDIHERPSVVATFMGGELRFFRPTNPHSGCYFLTSKQMDYWCSQPYFLDRDVRWCGPLESAASLGVMRAFRIYKPAPECIDFLELEHRSTYNLSLVGKDLRFLSAPKGLFGAFSRVFSLGGRKNE